MANRSANGFLKHSDGTSLNAAAGYTADFETEWYEAHGDFLAVSVVNLNASGSSATLDVTVEASPDGGTTVFSFPGDKNTAYSSPAAFAQFTSMDDTTVKALEYWVDPFTAESDWSWRVKFNYGGTIGTNTVTAKFVIRNTAQEIK